MLPEAAQHYFDLLAMQANGALRRSRPFDAMVAGGELGETIRVTLSVAPTPLVPGRWTAEVIFAGFRGQKTPQCEGQFVFGCCH